MPPKTPSLSVHISYRLDGSKVAYMRSREHDVCEYYPEFLERHLLYLQLPSKWMYDTTLQSLPEGKIQCRWLAGIVDDDSESGLLTQIAGQVEFLNNPGAAQLLRLLEISKIELAQPTPATQSPVVQPSDVPHQPRSDPQTSAPVAAETATRAEQETHAGDDGQRAPAAPTDPKVAELEDLLAQHKACYAKHTAENTELNDACRRLEEEERRAREERARKRLRGGAGGARGGGRGSGRDVRQRVL